MASSSSSHIKHDVFISFRGTDTRHALLGYLKSALCQKGIDVFVDDKLQRGDEISFALLQAIEGSQISLIIFSKDYASSKWCLEELGKVIECKERNDQIVIPIFYYVDPRDVRHQSGTYKDAFTKHEEKFHESKVQNWRSALKKSAELSGFHYPSNFQDEADMVGAIVKDVWAKLSTTYQSDPLKGLVGIHQSLAYLESLLNINSREVRIIGIWGMPGIGKTTIARAAYDIFSSQYDGCCFMENVKELRKNGLSYLLKQMFHELFPKEDLSLARRILSRKKVFIVLDDVNNSLHLEELVGERICLEVGSRVIVTSRDELVLQSGRVHGILKVEELNAQDSLKLFSLNAFNVSNPKLEYKELSQKAIIYAKGNPLALKVLGKYFCPRRSKEMWESALKKLKKYPNQDIQNVLQVSYNELDDVEKNLFLDIAFFFRGAVEKDAISLLNAFEFYPKIGLETLQGKALISIANGNKIEMHDLIQQMGWEIVREESIKNPESRSRLRDPKEVYDVLKNNQGTDAIEGIILDMSQISHLYLSVDTFKRMAKLRFLKFYYHGFGNRSNVHVPADLEPFSEKLRYLEWNNYPLESLPSKFSPCMLVEIHMRDSQVKTLWDGVQDVVNLKVLNLAGSEQLMELPDFSQAYHLEAVDLSNCVNLCHVHPSVLRLQKLVTLHLSGCQKLRSLKIETHLTSLRLLSVSFCRKLEEFSVSSKELRGLTLYKSGIDTLHYSIEHMSKLEAFIGDRRRLGNFQNELCGVRSLTILGLSNCRHVIDKEKLHILFDSLQWSLKELYLEDYSNLSELPDNISVLSRLKILFLDGGGGERLSASIKHLPSLLFLSIKNCRSLVSLPELPPFENIDASHCTSLVTVTAFKGYISSGQFQNCLKLNEESLHNIMETAHFKTGCYWMVHYPGGRVPEWVPYRTREANSIIIVNSIELSRPFDPLLGFFYCAVLPEGLSTGVFENSIIRCKCYSEHGERANFRNCYLDDRLQLNSSHVFLWVVALDREFKESIGLGDDDQYNPKVVPLITFEFDFVITEGGTDNVDDSLKHLEECGVCPVYKSQVLPSGKLLKEPMAMVPPPNPIQGLQLHMGQLGGEPTSNNLIEVDALEPVHLGRAGSCDIDQGSSSPIKKLKQSEAQPLPLLGLDLNSDQFGVGGSDYDNQYDDQQPPLPPTDKSKDFLFQPEICPHNESNDLTEIDFLPSPSLNRQTDDSVQGSLPPIETRDLTENCSCYCLIGLLIEKWKKLTSWESK